MSIIISKENCVGCKKCLSVCPGSLIKADDDKKAFMKYPKECWGCASCVKECKFGAISLYLGADMGGRGSKLTIETEETIIHWRIKESSGILHTIDINPKDANKY
ncbi:MAG: ferredoxin family protein [Lachnotalea sp.]